MRVRGKQWISGAEQMNTLQFTDPVPNDGGEIIPHRKEVGDDGLGEFGVHLFGSCRITGGFRVASTWPRDNETIARSRMPVRSVKATRGTVTPVDYRFGMRGDALAAVEDCAHRMIATSASD
jgi:hypothetical protein